MSGGKKQFNNMAKESKYKPSTKKIKVFISKKKRGGVDDAAIKQLKEKYTSIENNNITSFMDIPLSQRTLRGLKENGFTRPTEIQAQSIGPALQGRDILGAARTGSGKTLAFLVPILEVLHVAKWTNLDGVGALIISPTRELAYQTFQMLKKVGKHHDFSAALIIGGKNLQFERKRMDQCNIVICTPGRLLQHMDENPLFDCSNMQVLVLDEADRCLDLGFEKTMNAIVENLPTARQTLLYSATQTKSVQDLARLSLTEPLYIAPHENSDITTPESLQQNYVVMELQDKIAMVYSFIKNHLKQKIIVFIASCKQVKYIYEIFCKLRPGTSLLALYGTLHQERREQIYEEFCRKKNVVLFCTDVAARGLDFPEVNWVVQLDCPEDTDTYIHRAGRTARHIYSGECLLVLLPSEEKSMVKALNTRKIPINRIKIDPSKIQSPQNKLESLLAEYPNIKDTAQRAFVAYVKSIFLMKDKSVFDVHALNTDAFAMSMGLMIPPRIRFLLKLKKNATEKQNKRDEKMKSKKNEAKTIKEKLVPQPESSSEESSDDDSEDIMKKKIESSNEETDKNKETEKSDKSMKHIFKNDFDSDSDDDFIQIKRKNHQIEMDVIKFEPELELEQQPEPRTSKSKSKAVTKAAIAKKILKKKIIPNKKITFDEEGEAVVSETKSFRSEVAKAYENKDVGGINIEEAKQVLREEDQFDKLRFREKIRAKHREEKKRLKQKEKGEEEQDEFGSDSNDEGPDLSWLPDPDKIYGPAKADVDTENYQERRSTKDKEFSCKRNRKDGSSQDDNSEEEMTHHAKRQLLTKNVSRKEVKIKRKFSMKEISDSLTVNEAEELAMKLLSAKRK